MVIKNAGISIQQIIFEEIFCTSMASNLKYFYSTAIVPKHANSWVVFINTFRNIDIIIKSFSHTHGATIRTRAKKCQLFFLT